MTDLFSNPRFVIFREKVEAKGFFLKLLWSCKTGCTNSGRKFKYDDLALFAVCGQHQPTSGTILVKDYGERDGFGLYVETEGNGYDADVYQVCGIGQKAEVA